MPSGPRKDPLGDLTHRPAPLAVVLLAALSVFLFPAAARPASTGGGGSPRRVEHFPAERVTVEGIPPERVRLSVSVLNDQGDPVAGLTAGDFIVREGGRIQEIVDFGVERDREDRPLSAVFLVDRSGSIGRQMYKWKDACRTLVAVLRPVDEVQVALFSEEVRVVQPFTRDAAALAAAVSDIQEWGAGGTRILSALEETIVSLRARRGRKVIFLLTDGLDGGVSGPISANRWAADLATRAVQGQITIVTILPGPTGVPYTAAQDLAVHTGGWWLFSSGDLPALIGRLGERLMASYYLAYDSMRDPEDQARRAIEVTLARSPSPGTQVFTVAGVYGEAPLLDHLLEDLRDDEADLRARAALHLGRMQDEEAVRPLVRSLKDDDPRVRAAAAVALAERAQFDAVKAIGRLLLDDHDGVREAAILALGILLERGPDERTRGRILDALESIAPP